MTTSNKDEEITGLETKQQEDEHDIDTKIINLPSPVAKEEQPTKDPVNVDTPGWKSSQGDQGSGVFGTVNPVNVDTPGLKSSQGGQGSGVFGTGREKSLTDGQKGEEEAPTEENELAPELV